MTLCTSKVTDVAESHRKHNFRETTLYGSPIVPGSGVVKLGLRTLEFWVDNLNPEYLYPMLPGGASIGEIPIPRDLDFPRKSGPE